MRVPERCMTHGGVFHADDVFGYAFLHMLNPNIKLSRVKVVPADVKDTLVFDIGGGEFDHHTPETIEFRDPALKKNPYSSFGKIVRAFKDQVFDSEKEFKIFDSHLVIPIDLQDCSGCIWHGVANTLSMAIASFRPTWNEPGGPDAMDAAFYEAAKFAEAIIRRYIAEAHSIALSQIVVEKALSDKSSYRNHYVVLEKYVKYASYLPKDVNWVLYPSARGGIQLYSVLESGENRQLIPDDIADAMKKDDQLVFVHPGRFTAAFKTREHAVKWAEELGRCFDRH